MDILPSMSVVIIGAGPAGLSAALWCKQLGLAPTIIEKMAVAGGMQNVNFLNNDWVLGLPDMNGVDMAQNFFEHIKKEEIPILFNRSLSKVECDDDGFFLLLNNEECLRCQAVIVATGTHYLDTEIFYGIDGFLQVSKENIIAGPYAFSRFSHASKEDVVGSQHVAIVGAGDNAFENASLLLEKGCRVSMIARSEPKAQKKFLDAVMASEQFTLYESTKIVRFSSGLNQSSVASNQRLCLSLDNGYEISADILHILAGYCPNSSDLCDFFPDIIVDVNGFLVYLVRRISSQNN